MRRWLLIAAVTLAAAQCGFWLIGAWIGLHLVGWLVTVPLTVSLCIGASLNVLALLAFLLKRGSWGTRAFAAVQVGNILFSLVAAMLVSPAWSLLGAAPALATLFVQLLLSRAESRS